MIHTYICKYLSTTKYLLSAFTCTCANVNNGVAIYLK